MLNFQLFRYSREFSRECDSFIYPSGIQVGIQSTKLFYRVKLIASIEFECLDRGK